MNPNYSATVIVAIFATINAFMINLFAPIPDVIRQLNWVIVALGPLLFLAVAMATDPDTDRRHHHNTGT